MCTPYDSDAIDQPASTAGDLTLMDGPDEHLMVVNGPARPPGGGNLSPARLMVGVVVALALMAGSLQSAAQDGQETTTSTTPATTEATSTTQPTQPSSTSTTAEGSSSTGAGQTSTTSPEGDAGTTSTTADNSAAKAKAVANLNLAKAADVEIARELDEINQAANSTLEEIDDATARIETADAILDRTAAELANSDARQREIEADLRIKAIEGFKTRTVGSANPLLSDMDLTRSIRQSGLLAQASLSTAELLEELRGLLEERRIANAEASQAKADAEAAEQELQEDLTVLKEQQAAQVALKSEAERRVDVWAAELTAYAREDAAIQRVIVEKSQKTEVATAVNSPTQASTSGFQWPINARVSSEYGYRIHPIYRTRRLHTGMDIGASGGTPIASANAGVVIFAGRQGGYGNTVIVDHGGGITTLYAHQSRIGASVGQMVDRGDIVGFVGATGTATGNHLHFEVRVNGTPTNPRGYLP